jgi:hypothetical protein
MEVRAREEDWWDALRTTADNKRKTVKYHPTGCGWAQEAPYYCSQVIVGGGGRCA